MEKQAMYEGVYNWQVELWKSEDVLEITPEAKEILDKILRGPVGDIPQFVTLSGELVSVKNIARIRPSKRW